MAIGVVSTRVEISIEEHILDRLNYVHDNVGRLNVNDIANYLSDVISTLIRLRGLEARELGTRKYTEVKEINAAINALKAARGPWEPQQRVKDLINVAVNLIEKLEKMELRFG